MLFSLVSLYIQNKAANEDTYNILNLKKSTTMTDGEMNKLKQKQKEII
jgi:hypothetical protein